MIFLIKMMIKRCKEQISSINKLISQKVEQITFRHLVFSDKIATSKNEVRTTGQADGLVFGIWIHLSKNPRIKEIEFPGLTVEIPKEIAMTSLAIRMILNHEKSFNEQYLFLQSHLTNKFFAILFNCQQHTKKISTMTLWQSPQRNVLINITYPLRNVNSARPP